MKKFQSPKTDIGKNLRDGFFIFVFPILIDMLNRFQEIDFGENTALVGALLSVIIVIANRYSRQLK